MKIEMMILMSMEIRLVLQAQETAIGHLMRVLEIRHNLTDLQLVGVEIIKGVARSLMMMIWSSQMFQLRLDSRLRKRDKKN
jgi:hypothetical protein